MKREGSEEPFTSNGWCHDCAQGTLTTADPGFALYVDDEGTPDFWYCLYCGSNHVTLLNEDGSVAYEQGDLYGEDGSRRSH